MTPADYIAAHLADCAAMAEARRTAAGVNRLFATVLGAGLPPEDIEHLAADIYLDDLADAGEMAAWLAGPTPGRG